MAWDSDFAGLRSGHLQHGKRYRLGSPFSSWLPVVLFGVVSARRQVTSTAHGSARWADTAELARSGLLDGAGVVLCQTDGRALRREQAAARANLAARSAWPAHHTRRPRARHRLRADRSGKGIGTVIPTLLAWRASALVYDIKKELWTLTAGWRRQFSRCWRFEPTARDSVRFNPLLEVRRGDGEVRDVQNIADILVDPEGKREKRDHWKTSALHAPGRHHPPRPLRREGQVAGRRRPRSSPIPRSPILDTFQRMLTTNGICPRDPIPSSRSARAR